MISGSRNVLQGADGHILGLQLEDSIEVCNEDSIVKETKLYEAIWKLPEGNHVGST